LVHTGTLQPATGDARTASWLERMVATGHGRGTAGGRSQPASGSHSTPQGDKTGAGSPHGSSLVFGVYERNTGVPPPHSLQGIGTQESPLGETKVWGNLWTAESHNRNLVQTICPFVHFLFVHLFFYARMWTT